MRKLALVFLLAVFVPSLVLAWLAMRSARQQELVLERQQHLLMQGLASRQAQQIAGVVNRYQREFAQEVETMLALTNAPALAPSFDTRLREHWPLAQVGFAVTLQGEMLSPSMWDGPQARAFRLDNERFLTSRETVEVFWESPKGPINISRMDGRSSGPLRTSQPGPPAPPPDKSIYATKMGKLPEGVGASQVGPGPNETGPTEFFRLIGDATEGTLARFLQDQMTLIFWHRSPRNPGTVFGAQVDVSALIDKFKESVVVESALEQEGALALLDDAGQPVAVAPAGFRGVWRQPFVAEAVGELLPHWQVAAYLLHPGRLGQTARTLQLVIGLVVTILVLAIGVGGWLIVRDLNRQLRVARQKTDFVSNVSHELKTPLTSIRMFSELLGEGRVTDPDRQRQYLGIISAEASRLTRLINNVLDFSRLERGEKKYQFTRCDLTALVAEVVHTFRPHLEETGFALNCQLPAGPLEVHGDRDALAQVIVNLLSNAEKYSGAAREIGIELARGAGPDGGVQVRVTDRGLGVPGGSEEKIFEQFYRAHDALSSGIPGSGMGLTLARHIARAHGGDVRCEPRPGGGSCFILHLPANVNPGVA